MITLKQLKSKLEKDFGWENLESDDNKWFVDNLLKDTIQAINYTRCSEQLKDKLTLSFEEWKGFLYKPNPITYIVDDKEYEINELPAVYKRLTDKTL
jgi:hypothetical protein